jgi:hypothetical protein
MAHFPLSHIKINRGWACQLKIKLTKQNQAGRDPAPEQFGGLLEQSSTTTPAQPVIYKQQQQQKQHHTTKGQK